MECTEQEKALDPLHDETRVWLYCVSDVVMFVSYQGLESKEAELHKAYGSFFVGRIISPGPLEFYIRRTATLRSQNC